MVGGTKGKERKGKATMKATMQEKAFKALMYYITLNNQNKFPKKSKMFIKNLVQVQGSSTATTGDGFSVFGLLSCQSRSLELALLRAAFTELAAEPLEFPSASFRISFVMTFLP